MRKKGCSSSTSRLGVRWVLERGEEEAVSGVVMGEGGSSPLRVEARVEALLRRREEREAARAVGARDDCHLGDEVVVRREATHDGVARLVVGHLIGVRDRVRVGF